MKLPTLVFAAIGFTQLAGCALTPFEAEANLSSRLQRDFGTAPARMQSEATRAQVSALLAEPLSLDGATQIALINHPRVIAAFESLGIARADYVQAVLPTSLNVHHLALQADHNEPASLKWGFGIDLTRLITLPTTKQVATSRRLMQEAEATAEVLEVVAKARLAWIDLAVARQTADLIAQAHETAEAAAAAAEALLQAGNIAKVERDREALYAAEMRIARLQAEAALLPAREALLVALGLQGSQQGLLVEIARLSPPPDSPLGLANLETVALAKSTDYAIASGTLQAARAEQSMSWLASLVPNLGLEGERERDGSTRKQGLGISWAAPLFDLGAGERARRAAQTQRAQALADALELELQSQARISVAKAEAARQIAVTRRNVILPLSTDVFDGAVRDFNAMHISILDLLQERRSRLQAGQAAISATADYWRAQTQVDLLRAGLGLDRASYLPAGPAGRVSNSKPVH